MPITDQPLVTAGRLQHDLRELGVEQGMLLTVHSSLSALGWVSGGAPVVVESLLAVLGDDGTLVMPAATPQCGDPADWREPIIPPDRLDEVRDNLPLFDPQTTPTTLGIIPETFRNWPGTQRSNHPLESVCAKGPLAKQITAKHSLAFSEGREGPFGRLHDLDSRILLLGVGFNRCTALHYAESLSPNKRTMTVRFPIMEDGVRQWTEVPNVADDNDTWFPVIGQQYLDTRRPLSGTVGQADAILFPMHDLVDFAVDCFDTLV